MKKLMIIVTLVGAIGLSGSDAYAWPPEWLVNLKAAAATKLAQWFPPKEAVQAPVAAALQVAIETAKPVAVQTEPTPKPTVVAPAPEQVVTTPAAIEAAVEIDPNAVEKEMEAKLAKLQANQAARQEAEKEAPNPSATIPAGSDVAAEESGDDSDEPKALQELQENLLRCKKNLKEKNQAATQAAIAAKDAVANKAKEKEIQDLTAKALQAQTEAQQAKNAVADAQKKFLAYMQPATKEDIPTLLDKASKMDLQPTLNLFTAESSRASDLGNAKVVEDFLQIALAIDQHFRSIVEKGTQIDIQQLTPLISKLSELEAGLTTILETLRQTEPFTTVMQLQTAVANLEKEISTRSEVLALNWSSMMKHFRMYNTTAGIKELDAAKTPLGILTSAYDTFVDALRSKIYQYTDEHIAMLQKECDEAWHQVDPKEKNPHYNLCREQARALNTAIKAQIQYIQPAQASLIAKRLELDKYPMQQEKIALIAEYLQPKVADIKSSLLNIQEMPEELAKQKQVAPAKEEDQQYQQLIAAQQKKQLEQMAKKQEEVGRTL